MSAISLIYYRVNELEFKFNESIKTNASFQIKPKIECKVAKKEDNLFVNLTLKINEDISSPVPFNLKVVLGGTFKVKEGAEGYECGITLEKFNDVKVGDIFEAYYMEEYRPDWSE